MDVPSPVLTRSRRRLALTAALGAAVVVLASFVSTQPAHAAAVDTVDEIHSGYGDNAGTEMWVFWRGSETAISYGTSAAYGSDATATQSPITPVDIGGPFYRVELTGLTAGTVYHYRIGSTGLDHEFETAPTGDRPWVWDDIGDTGTTYYDPAAGPGCDKQWMSQVWAQIAAEKPDLVTHGGDISYANECGQPSVHQFFQDIAPIATMRPMEFAWGNHEYGAPRETPPPGTPRDSMANYKGRAYVPNPQSTPNDTPLQLENPGCSPAPGTVTNGCQGSDWGYFVAGHVLFISEPEPWYSAYAAWQVWANALMAQEESDPNVLAFVTYGHRPAYTSLYNHVADRFAYQPDLQLAVNALGDSYSPAARPDGKYLLNVSHHIHGGEYFAPQHGVVNVTDGGGGTKEVTYNLSAPGSVWQTSHLEHLRVTVDGGSLKLEFVCGPVFTPNPTQDACTPGDTIFSRTLTSPVAR